MQKKKTTAADGTEPLGALQTARKVPRSLVAIAHAHPEQSSTRNDNADRAGTEP